MRRTVKMGNMEMRMHHSISKMTGRERITIDCGSVSLVIREDGTVHVILAERIHAYNAKNEVVTI